MADIQNKHSVPRAQGLRRVHASTKPAPIKSATTKPQTSTRKHRNPKKRERLPPSLRYTETKRGKTTIRRYAAGRSVYRLEEVKGKLVECVEIFNSSDHHAISVRFQDKTTINFSIEPGFILATEYADWKTGNWRPIKPWPLIHSQSLRA
jgi:hypothetical protein